MNRACVTLLALGVIAAPVLAQTQQQLKTIEQDLQKSEAERTRLAAESEKVARDIETAKKQAITLAKDIQDQEYSLTVLETRLKDLEATAAEQTTALSRRDAQMRKTLMALERLALRPADALAMSPLSPDDAVRAAILLRAAVPAISASASATAVASCCCDQPRWRRRRRISEWMDIFAATPCVKLAIRASIWSAQALIAGTN